MIPIVFLLNPYYWTSNNSPLRLQPVGAAQMQNGTQDYKQYLLGLKQQLLTQFKQVEESLSKLDN